LKKDIDNSLSKKRGREVLDCIIWGDRGVGGGGEKKERGKAPGVIVYSANGGWRKDAASKEAGSAGLY